VCLLERWRRPRLISTARALHLIEGEEEEEKEKKKKRFLGGKYINI